MKNVHSNTADHLDEAIVSGRYAAGASLPPEPILGEELGVSRTVVREAVKSLIEGLVTTGPKVGTRVQSEDHWSWFDPDGITWQSRAGLTPEFLRDLQDLRRIVEPAAVRLADERATAQDIAAIEAAYQGMAHAVKEGGDYVTHDLRFHQGLRLACQPPAEPYEQGPGRTVADQFRAFDQQKRGARQLTSPAPGGARCRHCPQSGKSREISPGPDRRRAPGHRASIGFAPPPAPSEQTGLLSFRVE